MAEGARAGGVQSDLEKELTCSICTELLYQPLTLLDCLHTFCGACLKEWFAFQASTATSIHPYTCPSCRASVRTTQPNAFTNTLLVSFLKEHPERGKSEEDKKSDREKYKRGDNVLPKLRKREEPNAEEDSRLLEEVQQLSLREVGIPSGASSSLEPPRDRRRRARSRERSRESRRSHDERGSSRNTPETSVSREIIPPRALDHQSSLRSLLSASEMDPQEMEEEVRQIIEDGLLDGIDMENIDVALEDEITERIMHAVQRRQADRQRERRERRERLAREGLVSSSGTSTPRDLRSPTLRDDEQARRRHLGHGRSESGTSTPQNSSRPPISRPNLIDAANQGGRTHHRRSSSQGSSRSARRAEIPAPILVSSSRSVNLEIGERPATSDSAPAPMRRQSEGQRRAALDERQQFRNSLQVHSNSNPNSPRRAVFNIPASESPTVSTPVSPPPSAPASTPFQAPSSRRTTDPAATRQPRPPNNSNPPMATPPPFPRSSTDPTSEPRSRQASATAPEIATRVVYPEPQISCKKCGKEHIEYELHYNCSRCDEGQYNICRSCYRLGRGCKHWFGFGWSAWQRYERAAPPGGYPPNHPHPHILVGRRYRRSLTRLTESTLPPHVLQSEDDPALRLEKGVFCDLCKAYANACYWKCDTCNEGDWGFCNDCVNQGRHCTHPLLPIAHKGQESNLNTARAEPSTPPSQTLAPPSSDSGPTTPPLTPRTASLIQGPGLITIANTVFRPLTFTTICNICSYPIPPSHTRYHCRKCNAGDYDICMGCYHKLVVSGKISKEDGMNGWRRCLMRHRMVVVGFEDRDGGQRRVVQRDLVGGFALRDEDENGGTKSPTGEVAPPPRERPENLRWKNDDGTVHRYRSPSSTTTSPTTTMPVQQQRFPPDGGVGLRVQALWGYFPGENAKDELTFPKHAEIREAEDINGDWYWGVYAGSKGLFPGNHGRIVGGGAERLGMI